MTFGRRHSEIMLWVCLEMCVNVVIHGSCVSPGMTSVGRGMQAAMHGCGEQMCEALMTWQHTCKTSTILFPRTRTQLRDHDDARDTAEVISVEVDERGDLQYRQEKSVESDVADQPIPLPLSRQWLHGSRTLGVSAG